MNPQKVLESKKEMIHGSKKKRIKEGQNCLVDYRLVIDTYKEIEEVVKKIENETNSRKKALLNVKLFVLSKKLDYYWKKWKKIEKSYHANIPIEADVPASTIFPHNLNNVLISAHSTIGEGCIIFQGVTIGSNTLSDSKNHGSPKVGNNVYIGAGATILGNITIGDNVRIGANTTVTKSVEEDTTVVSQPNVYIKHKEKKENHQW